MASIKELKQLSKQLTVLYVEDDVDLANSVITYLSKLFKEVVYVKNGQDGLDLYQEESYDLVITDLAMPKMNGFQMATQIKKMQPEQKIIVISAHADTKIYQGSIKLSLDGFISKPVDYKEMNKTLYTIVQKINMDKENKNYVLQLNAMIVEQNHYTNALNKVAIVSKTDLKGNITYANDYFCKVCGYSKDELIGQPHNIIRHPDVPKSVFKELWQTIQNGQIWEGKVKNQAKNGEPYYVNATIIPLYDLQQKEICEYIGIRFLTTNDEHEKRHFKKRVMQTYQELKKENEEHKSTISNLQQHIEKLEQKLQEQQNVPHNITQENNYKYKYFKALKEIDFLEEHLKNKEIKHENSIQTIHANHKKIIDSHGLSLKKIAHQQSSIEHLQQDNEKKGQEIIKLHEQLHSQRAYIINLKDTYKKTEKTDIKKVPDKNIFSIFHK